TADRRGGILISFGFHRTSLEGINPSKRMSFETSRPRFVEIHDGDRVERPPVSLAFCIPSECPVSLKGVGLRFVGRFQPTFAFTPNRVRHIRPSDRTPCVSRC